MHSGPEREARRGEGNDDGFPGRDHEPAGALHRRVARQGVVDQSLHITSVRIPDGRRSLESVRDETSGGVDGLEQGGDHVGPSDRVTHRRRRLQGGHRPLNLVRRGRIAINPRSKRCGEDHHRVHDLIDPGETHGGRQRGDDDMTSHRCQVTVAILGKCQARPRVGIEPEHRCIHRSQRFDNDPTSLLVSWPIREARHQRCERVELVNTSDRSDHVSFRRTQHPRWLEFGRRHPATVRA